MRSATQIPGVWSPDEPFDGRTVLVTGAAGFLGSGLCRSLGRAGARVHAVTRRPPPEDSGSVAWIQADCADPEELRSLLTEVRPQVIYHLTGHGVGSPDLGAVLPTLRDDLVACVTMLTVATEIGYERMILAGSMEEPMTPDIPPNSPYAAAKACSTTYARMFHRVLDAPVTVVRPYMTYGPGQRSHKIIPSIVRSCLRGESPEIGSGDRIVDWVYLDDVVDGMIKAARAPDVEGLTIDLGSGAGVAIREVAERIVALTGAPPPVYDPARKRPFEVVRLADLAPARERLGWTPATSLDEGLRRTIAWHRSEAEKGRYVRT